eukprot:scaffold72674_cov57-Phaeocystis_antarctica.AAC.2
MRPLSVSGARRSASVSCGGAEASVNMPRPMGSAIERRQSSSSRDCCSWMSSWSVSSGPPLPSRSAIARDEQSSRRTSASRRSRLKRSADLSTSACARWRSRSRAIHGQLVRGQCMGSAWAVRVQCKCSASADAMWAAPACHRGHRRRAARRHRARWAARSAPTARHYGWRVCAAAAAAPGPPAWMGNAREIGDLRRALGVQAAKTLLSGPEGGPGRAGVLLGRRVAAWAAASKGPFEHALPPDESVGLHRPVGRGAVAAGADGVLQRQRHPEREHLELLEAEAAPHHGQHEPLRHWLLGPSRLTQQAAARLALARAAAGRDAGGRRRGGWRRRRPRGRLRGQAAAVVGSGDDG